MIHNFPEDIVFQGSDKFTDPFRYFPHPLVRKAAEDVVMRIESDPFLASELSEGKMLGVLVCKDKGHKAPIYIAAFSGNVGGRSSIDGFVPAIYDLTSPKGYYRRQEHEISVLNRQIVAMSDSEETAGLRFRLKEAEKLEAAQISSFRQKMAESKARRDSIRESSDEISSKEELIRESQFEKAEFKRLKSQWAARTSLVRQSLKDREREIKTLKKRRAEMSDRLQEWIFNQYIVHNAAGESSSISDIFRSRGLTPPGGTGECAAPKLLEYAYLHGLKPLAMGEFWYGRSHGTAVRTHGHFYPSCTSKCGPLLDFMLKGLRVETEDRQEGHNILKIYEDDHLIVVEKPSGMPSVPGLDGKKSLLEFLQEENGAPICSVHRLDMDTSGVMVYAKSLEVCKELQRQFEEHTIRKTYIARLSKADSSDRFALKKMMRLKTGDTGSVSIPLSPDYDERPRQKADHKHGKESLTEYKVISENKDGTCDILFFPHTGRTHQLRVHSAHTSGLGRPIAGDRLYGGSPHQRLCLHASSLTFHHPVKNKEMTFDSQTSSPFKS